LLKSAQHFLVPDFSYFFYNTYGPTKFIEVAMFHPIYAQKSEKFLTCLRGAKQFAKLLLFLLTHYVFCCFEHLFMSPDDYF
jgi:hypothetical protein